MTSINVGVPLVLKPISSHMEGKRQRKEKQQIKKPIRNTSPAVIFTTIFCFLGILLVFTKNMNRDILQITFYKSRVYFYPLMFSCYNF